MIQVRWASMKDPVVHVEDLKAWLRGKRDLPLLSTCCNAMTNALIGELLQEIEDAEKGSG